ncbi:protein TsgA [Clostridium homopropionicum DSM 5847]|uniref:Protein TsgA n=1 Tax=Clostridium homopropionicum DSM 5847 TaxID=1121318 RepID=A0A0L6ZAR2_9CLOT|nr:MFS transporter [Clostridium homopropionicum]KOA20064.1 protein TsgA [Clostridium homopropionicum DSM 5847]SFG85664.1 Fucose permease [Clostridium homopropionicum]
MVKIKNKIVIIYIFFMMILSAMCDNVRGPFVPIIKQEFSVNNTGIATAIMVCSLGYMLFTFIGGILCEKVGQKRVFDYGFIFIIFASTVLYFSKSFVVYLIALFLLNSGQALVCIGTNTLIPIISIGFQAILMNLTHFSYGIGATFTQRFTGILLYNGVTWRQIYLLIAIISVIIFIGFLFVKIPEAHISKKNSINHKEVFKNKLVYMYMLAMGFYVAAEMNTGSWFVNFMHDVYKYDERMSSAYAALFFGAFTLGRLLGGLVVEKIGLIKSVLYSVTLGTILQFIGVIFGESSMIIVSISGLFFSITFPTLVLSISKVFKQNISYITGIVITAGSLMSMLVNLLIGVMNDLIGVYKTYYVIPICLGLCTIFVCVIYKNTTGNGMLNFRRKQCLER